MKPNQLKSGISIAIQKTLDSIHSNQPLAEDSKSKEFTIKIANSLSERESVFQLGYSVYLEKGYIQPNSQEWLIQPYDSDPQTIILIVQDKNKNLAGSLTLVFSESSILPSEKIYGTEINELRMRGEKLVEISRLIINPEFRNSKEVLILLFNYLAIFTYHIKHYSSLVIEVNPRHKAYYKSLLNFEEIGVEKPCPVVENAPAVLLYLPLTGYQSEVIRCKAVKEHNKRERSLYAYFLNHEQESLVVYYLVRQLKPMTAEEKQYFGISEIKKSSSFFFPLHIDT